LTIGKKLSSVDNVENLVGGQNGQIKKCGSKPLTGGNRTSSSFLYSRKYTMRQTIFANGHVRNKCSTVSLESLHF
jgi:hypothetical protein